MKEAEVVMKRAAWILALALAACGNSERGGSAWVPSGTPGGGGAGGTGGSGGTGGGLPVDGGAALSILGASEDPSDQADLLLDFGLVTIHESASRSLVLTNAGDEVLRVAPVSVASPFSTDLVEGGSIPEGAAVLEIAPASSEVARFEFAPTESGAAQQLLAVASSGGFSVLRLAGEGTALPPCDLEVRPPDLRWGIVDKDHAVEAALAVGNLSDHACEITELRLDDESGRLELVEGGPTTIEAHGESTIRLRLSWGETGGTARLVLVANGRDVSIPLGEIEPDTEPESCVLLAPEALDFGDACGAQIERLAVINVCSTPFTIADVRVTGAGLGLAETVTLPMSLASGAQLDLAIALQAEAPGPVSGTVEVDLAETDAPETVAVLGEVIVCEG